MPTVDLIIPAYNEAGRIGPTLSAYLEYFGDDVRLVVVLNGCTDTTAKVVEGYQTSAGSRLQLITIPEAVGKGRAIIEGWKASSAEVVGFVDADASTSPAEFEKLLHELEGVDGVIASRFMAGGTVVNRQSSLRTVMSRAFALTVRLIFQMPYRDTQCGAKVFRRNVVTSVLDQLHETSMVFDVELLWRLHKHGATVREMPTYWVDKAGSPLLGQTGSFLKTGLAMVTALFRIRFRK